MTMMTRELEYSALPFYHNLWSSRTIFVAFLSFIPTVMLNLLTGMAVNGIEEIKRQVYFQLFHLFYSKLIFYSMKAETTTYTRLVERVSLIESVLLGDPTDFLGDSFDHLTEYWFLSRMRTLLANINPVPSLLRSKRFRKLMYVEGTALFYEYLPENTFTIFPNRKSGRCSNDIISKPIMCRCHADFTLPSAIIQDVI